MKTVYFFFILFLLYGCSPDTPQETSDFNSVQLLCESSESYNGQEQSAIYALFQDSKVKLAEIHACQTILPENYEEIGIPKDALSAVGGTGDDHNEYVYAQVKKDNKNTLGFYIYTPPSANNHGSLTDLAIYKKGKFQLLRPLHLADLAGYYWCERKDTSYVLFLGLKGPKLISKLFATEEPLPAEKVLQRALPEFASSPDLDFNCELNALVFQSALGNGHVFWRPDSAAVVFNQFLGKEGAFSFELISF